MNKLELRELKKRDCKKISELFKEQGWNKPESQFIEYMKYQETGKRDIIIAELEGKISGYLTINWLSKYEAFKEKQIPEIVDLNVFKKYQRQGIATKLMDEAEQRIKKQSKYAGIGFGLTKDYEAAQKLYVNRNYKPDGNGIVKESRPLEYGENVIIDDDLVFYLTKELK